MVYPFSIGDLICSASVLKNYMETASVKVPWADLRYLFGEIMYGGHIVNDFDRLVCATYLDFFMRDGLMDSMALFPYPDDDNAETFYAPPTSSSFEKVGLCVFLYPPHPHAHRHTPTPTHRYWSTLTKAWRRTRR